MSLGAKRSASPLPRHLDNIRKIRLAAPKDRDKTRHESTAAPSACISHGQEVISLSPFLPQANTYENVNDLILQTAARLAREGKRLTRAPQLLPDGIAFDWVSDLTAQGESLKTLLSVQGIRSADLDKVLSRAAMHTARASTLEPPKTEGLQNTQLRFNASAPPGSQLLPGNASNPIVIDEDDEEPEIVETSVHIADPLPCPPHVQITQLPASDVPGSPKRDVAGPSRPPVYDSEPPRRSKTTGRHASVEAETAKLCAAVDDTASVVTYASPRSEHAAKTGRDLDEDGSEEGSPSRDHVGDLPPCGSPESVRNHPALTKRQLEKRPADYGNWKSLAAESSDADMDDVRPSSRESSPGRVFPHQSPRRIPGLSFLPQTYDASDLATQEAFALASRSESRSDSEPSSDAHERSPPKCIPPSKPSHVERYRGTRRTNEVPSDPASSDGPLDRSIARKKAKQHTEVVSDSDQRDSDEDMGVDVTTEEGSRSPRSRIRQRSRHRAQVRASEGRPQVSSEQPRRPNSARRAPSRSGADMSSDSEHDERELAGQTTLSGHTVIIPKAEFARGRRLLAPKNQDLPSTTILMRGDAHFIDQRRKARITRWSLPVEDDSRHVEDACLVGDDTVVVGYNKGPCQVSLIPVRVDQRPRRIDLTYRAHSTVIENRSAGTSTPNPGIACLAPVGDESFLSGGHDKTVRLWKLTRERGQNATRAAFSASSVRVPTQHTQAVQAVAYSPWNNAVYTASGDLIATTQLDARAATEPARVSGKVTQVHVHPQDPRLVALEIDHMDYQVHFYDTRSRGFGRKPWLEFGYRAAPPKPRSAPRSAVGASVSVPKLGSRYIRGATVNSLFARGYADGVVLVWDYRNGAQKEVLERFRFERPAEVAHTVLAGTDVVAYGGYSATFWSTLGA